MKKGILTLVLIFAAFAVQAQRNVDRTNFRAGVNGGLVIGDFSEAYSFGLGVDAYHHWGVSKLLDVGVTAGFFNAFGSKESISVNGLVAETEFANVQYIPVGASLRVYPGKNVGFKFGADIGYAVGINEGNDGALYYRPSIGIDLRGGISELNISYFAVNDDVTFSSVLLGYLFLF
ncbi:hypothetical protein FEE95_14815 [Maribacter algarum]|uniref:Outer membrane protein beta-barrel domain-containing protein n=1 Tax=Maribacter algarum (ex Zhang et al. 2020) TaxID=2578118 RepID=A0A5S3PN69_9FLAO|nr:hypothetical protein [Maribacter algarum]TMM55918.1 hypothetical protein FEE95_14815 [Maribacter algarum]